MPWMVGEPILSAPYGMTPVTRKRPVRVKVEQDKFGYSMLDEDFQRRLDGYSRLLDVTRMVAAEVDLEKVLSVIVNEARQALHCEQARLYQYHNRTERLIPSSVAVALTALNDTVSDNEPPPRPLGDGIIGYSATRRVICNVTNPELDPRWSPEYDGWEGIPSNMLTTPLVSPSGDELLGVLELTNKTDREFDVADEELLLAFSQHAAVAIDRAKLVDRLQQQQQMQASLHAAREIQRRFMPTSMPTIPGYEAASWWFPQQGIGGDYCDLFPLQSDRFALCVADVSGHGLGPSLLMASVRAALRALALEHSSSQLLLERVGRSLAADMQHGAFVTMILASLDTTSHTVEYANAGHAPAFLYRMSTDEVFDLEATGLPIGVVEQPRYPLGPRVSMESGDWLILCTDGIVESMNVAQRQFGKARLHELVRRHAYGSTKEMAQAIGDDVSAYFVGESPQDDLTVLALRRLA